MLIIYSVVADCTVLAPTTISKFVCGYKNI